MSGFEFSEDSNGSNVIFGIGPCHTPTWVYLSSGAWVLDLISKFIMKSSLTTLFIGWSVKRQGILWFHWLEQQVITHIYTQYERMKKGKQ